MTEGITLAASISVVAFVVGSMLSMGLSLTVRQVSEPLRNAKLVVLVLAANFILAPAVAMLLRGLIPLGEGHGIGLILLSTAVGAPFLPKLAQTAKAAIALSVGLMVLLMVATVIYIPLVLPLLLPGVTVNPLDIARPLVVLMLIPLGIGLFIRARYADAGARMRPIFAQISNAALVILFVTMVLLNWRALVDALSNGVFVTTALFIVTSFAIGFLVGGRDTGARAVTGLGTAQRNISASLVVASQNFADPGVLVVVLVGGILMLSSLMPLAAALGRRYVAVQTQVV